MELKIKVGWTIYPKKGEQLICKSIVLDAAAHLVGWKTIHGF